MVEEGDKLPGCHMEADIRGGCDTEIFAVMVHENTGIHIGVTVQQRLNMILGRVVINQA